SDPEKRKAYDARGMAGGFDPRAFAGGFASDLGDLFSTLFNRGRPRGQQMRGADLRAEVNLTFEQAMRGAEVSVTVPKRTACGTCGGTGARPGTAPVVCPRCGGRGVDAQSQGFFSISQPCPQCGGRGSVIEDPCPTCAGSG